MTHISIEQVTASYNGKPGCMCGCQGTYKLPSHASIAQANINVGYKAYDETSVSDRSVKLALNKINEGLALYEAMTDDEQYQLGIRCGVVHSTNGDDSYAWFDTDTRTNVVYFK